MNNQIFITPDNSKWFDLTDLPNEKWATIDDYEDLYKISTYGRLKHLPKYKNNKEFIMKPYKDKYGRYVSYLYKNGNKKAFYTHRLVGQAFIPNLENKPEINHIVPITKELCDNRVSNLEWVTSKENFEWTKKCGNYYNPMIGKSGEEHPCSKPIVRLSLDMTFIDKWANAREIDRKLKIDYRFVSRNCNHLCKTAKGYIFMFEEEYNEQMGKY